MNPATTQLFDLDSTVMGATVPVAVVLPPDFQQEDESLPLLINLHGGDGDRGFLVAGLPHFQSMWETGKLPPLVMVTFSSGGTSWYVGNWEKFVVDELPTYLNTLFNTRLDREGTVLTGTSMGGYGTLKIGFKYPERFSAIASLEAAIEPCLSRTPGNRRNTWFRMEAIESKIWGAPLDEAAWEADNPATIAYRNADAIRASGLDIYLEVGDQDYLNLHDGNEFLHRVLWDHDIRKDGRPFARGLEFGTSGLHRPGHDLVATGKIFDKAIYRYIDAQETQTFRYVSFLVNIPSGYAGVASVNYDGKTITIEESGGKGRTLSLMASDLF